MAYSAETIHKLIRFGKRTDLVPAVARMSVTETMNLESQVMAKEKSEGRQAALALCLNLIESRQKATA